MEKKANEIKKIVKEGYAKVAGQGTSCCSSGSCCRSAGSPQNISKIIGYSEAEISAAPDGANLGLGCGNPVAIASLKEGDIVLDLGSGPGFDAFLAARRVGRTGRVIGVDMTPEMLARARANAQKGDFGNVEFRLGEIENLPVKDGSIDVIISNCVINLSPDKAAVFKEAFRVLKPGGRLMVSDLALVSELPAAVKESIEAYVGCLAGAIEADAYLELIAAAGFQEVSIVSRSAYPTDGLSDELKAAGNAVASIKVSALKP
ncbi:arsenite S-adenosylmethyltransferase [candidate division WOR-1 bacterium RIFOXYA12_FULL_52_29]|uniref:Arsenite methyltransferase n=1 Tax=candidate division WOR-1 bacterium RIFOXYC12_FULL_54_18 TaxID=1802584 RepID=A0A1F4T877_UNCSA|nr:MAG: arsenite S-adenosylmethyltransferase [candidate division WOR-1 bacterium RIFOXYA2_FULL_51_19]OGC18487.1 MAG: arsenite S-adenosylmethyltransferase [candidate division WOR-1 bacterium RIFOXYA12_FULL_52_29]OGC27344.1 MAG: arsenite S-adenosylmethyltransferase [candidate division WOR-1 bacterium RIFOXYB2_FULL_45_9]OGC28904.1 MAG: arsenite S-adenosylmethyltransferase [candidate division WOR-1 bacterium RIFOXYC12_FULL_54_18]OGC30046.1 MAG: arsenite S-adenosylmethyltransferase [candidate divisi